jgi:hypothetical protein
MADDQIEFQGVHHGPQNDGESRQFDLAVNYVESALGNVQGRLRDLRHQRDEIINPEIRQLVAEEERLERMLRVSQGKVKSE